MQRDLRIVFYEAMIAFGAANAIPVAFPRLPFDPGTLDRYLRVATMAAAPEVFDLCGHARYLWILQVSVFVRDGTSELAAMSYADALQDRFPVRHRLVGSDHTFEVQTPPFPAVPITLPGWYALPVSFRVQTLH